MTIDAAQRIIYFPLYLNKKNVLVTFPHSEHFYFHSLEDIDSISWITIFHLGDSSFSVVNNLSYQMYKPSSYSYPYARYILHRAYIEIVVRKYERFYYPHLKIYISQHRRN
ncbi:hypothetical protein RCL_jg28535.t1 [Rhizophagus clarus]|uniref:Uncharacterized protein n=1 Tax=Rhizophagus clarus TaxID=94130 RepID=A0A8H3LVP5_9GLOM|nr:hypothetical protein RCL_jg28535.t1 [Rhizophagus clarus]